MFEAIITRQITVRIASVDQSAVLSMTNPRFKAWTNTKNPEYLPEFPGLFQETMIEYIRVDNQSRLFIP